MAEKKRGRPPKAKTYEGSLTDKDKAYMRMKCLSLVVENGSRIDSKSPQDRAEEYYNFVINNMTKVQEIKEAVDTVVDAVAREIHEAEQVDVTQTPFGESGRKQVLLA